MNGKPLGMKTKHMGMKWLWVDDMFSVISSEYQNSVGEFAYDQNLDEGLDPRGAMLESLNNITFEIPEEPEFKNNAPDKLILDEYPGKIQRRRHKSDIPTRGLKNKTQPKTPNSNIPKYPSNFRPEESHRLKNLYFYLHSPAFQQPGSQNHTKLNEKHEELQKVIKSNPFTSTFKRFLESTNKRVPGCLTSL